MLKSLAPHRLRPVVRDVLTEFFFQSGLTSPRRVGADKLTVVTFHRVLPVHALAEYPLDGIAVSVEEFQWFMQFFVRHFTCGSLTETFDRWQQDEPTEKPRLAITFDDGQLDNFLYALPVLEKHHVKASFYVPCDAIDRDELLWHDRAAYAATRLLEQDPERANSLLSELGVPAGLNVKAAIRRAILQLKNQEDAVCRAWVHRIEQAANQPVRPDWDGMMSWEQIAALASQGHEVGSHSLTHSILTHADDAQLQREVAGSLQRLREVLDRPIRSFCYPNGDHDGRVTEAVRRCGYGLAVTTRWGANHRQADPLQLTRFDMSSRHTRNRRGQLSAPRLAFRLSPYFPDPSG